MFVFVKAQILVYRVFNEKNMGMRIVLWKDRGMCFVYVLFYVKTGVCVLCTFCFLLIVRGACFDIKKKYGDISFALWEDRVMRFALMYVVFFSIKHISIA